MAQFPFRIELARSFYGAELYGPDGDHVYDLETAVEVAEENFGTDWQSVYNGNESQERVGDEPTRDEILAGQHELGQAYDRHLIAELDRKRRLR